MMYEVYLDDKLLFYPNDEDHIVLNAKLDQALNEAGTFECDVPTDNPNYDSINVRSSMVRILKDGAEIFLGEVREVTQNFDFTQHIYAVGELAFLFDSIQPQARYQGTPEAMFTAIVAYHNNQVEDRKKFTKGNVLVTDPNDYIYHYTNYEDTLTALRDKMCDPLNGYLRVRKVGNTRYLDLVPLNMYGTYCEQQIQFGENMLDYSANTSAESIATAVVPIGAILEEENRTSSAVEGLDEYVTIKSVNDGVDYIFDSVAVSSHGWVKVVKKWDDINTPSILKSRAEDWLESAQYATMTLELNAVDLSLLDSNIDAFNVGDTVHAVAEPFGMNTTFPVRKKTTYLNDLSKNYITLSNVDPAKSYTSQASNAVALIQSQIPSASPILEEARSRALAMLLDETTHGYVVFEYDEDNKYIESISICNAPTIDASTTRWRWSGCSFGYMERDNIDRPWSDVKVAMTSNGEIVADMITTGVLSGDRVRGGTFEIGGVSYGKDGSLVVKNASGTTLVTLDKNGLTLSGGQTISYSNISNTPTIPTKTSQLTNDSGFKTVITANDITTGTMSADRIRGGELLMGEDEGIDGKIIVKDSDNNTIVELNGTDHKSKIGGFNIGKDKLSVGDAAVSSDKIGCGSAGYGIVNLVGNNSGNDSKYGYIQISNSGGPTSCLDGIRIYGNGKVVKYKGNGSVDWTRYLSNIPTKDIGEYFNDYLIGPQGKSFAEASSGDLVGKK